jgi:hypothetical protein
MTEETKLTEINLELNIANQIFVEKLYHSLKVIVGDKNMDTNNIISITTNLMQIIEKYPDLKGEEKKFILIHVIKKFVKDNVDNENQKNVLTFIDLFLPSFIDTVISVDKKEIIIKVKKGIKDCFTCCF